MESREDLTEEGVRSPFSGGETTAKEDYLTVEGQRWDVDEGVEHRSPRGKRQSDVDATEKGREGSHECQGDHGETKARTALGWWFLL
jgi:hypothetical protein